MPVRRCAGCGLSVPKHELLRLALAGDDVVADPTGRAPGRGAYVHDDPDCRARAARPGALARAFRRRVSADVDALGSIG